MGIGLIGEQDMVMDMDPILEQDMVTGMGMEPSLTFIM